VAGSVGEETLALHLRALGAPPHVRQHRFGAEIDRDWRFDFCWPARRLAVEVDGAVHRIKGRFRADLERHNVAQMLGWTVLRFSPRDVASGKAVDVILAALTGDQAAALVAIQRKEAGHARGTTRRR
jgi:very-short-patch-repair endonuclease